MTMTLTWRRWAMTALLPLALTGCGGEPAAPGQPLAPGEFVDIIVALRQAEREVELEAHPDSLELEFERRKLEILDRHNATEEQVRAFMESNRDRPAVIAAAWDSIAQRLRMAPTRLEEDRPWSEEHLPDERQAPIPRLERSRVPSVEDLAPDLVPDSPPLDGPSLDGPPTEDR